MIVPEYIIIQSDTGGGAGDDFYYHYYTSIMRVGAAPARVRACVRACVIIISSVVVADE